MIIPLEIIATHCNWSDGQVIAYGYTFDRETLEVTYKDGQLWKSTERHLPYDTYWMGGGTNIDEQNVSDTDWYGIFVEGVKRWYISKTCPKLIKLCEQFGLKIPLTN